MRTLMELEDFKKKGPSMKISQELMITLQDATDEELIKALREGLKKNTNLALAEELIRRIEKRTRFLNMDGVSAKNPLSDRMVSNLRLTSTEEINQILGLPDLSENDRKRLRLELDRRMHTDRFFLRNVPTKK